MTYDRLSLFAHLAEKFPDVASATLQSVGEETAAFLDVTLDDEDDDDEENGDLFDDDDDDEYDDEEEEGDGREGGHEDYE